MSYLIERLLVTERHRPQISEEGTSEPGEKTPITMELKVSPSMNTLLTTTTDGEFKLIQEHEAEEVKSNFFEFPEDSEDLLREIVESVYLAGASEDWGGVALRDTFDKSYFESVETYFNQYGLELYQVFSGLKGIQQISDLNLLYKPNEEGEAVDSVDRELLEEWMDEHLHAGSYRDKNPVIYTPALDDYLVFTAPPEFVGQINRIGNYANVLIHNPFGMVVTKLGDDDQEDVSE